MRIVHLSTFTAEGGAGIATFRIHKKLLEKGVKSDLVVLRSSGKQLPAVTEVTTGWLYRAKDFFFYRFDIFFLRKKFARGLRNFRSTTSEELVVIIIH